MKKIILLATFIAIAFTVFAQNADLRRKIEVSGSAEQEVTPDIINVTIALQEYMNGKTKITIDQLEGQLENAVKDAGIAKEDFTINNLSAFNNYYQKKKTPDFLAGKQYSIRFHDLNKFDQILGQVDPKGISSTNIDSYDYSKIADVKRQLKIQALLATKEKATYLLTSIGEKLGGVIGITEVDNNAMPVQYSNRVMAFNAIQPASDIDFKKIKLSYQINAVFEISN
ncbi:SIMPL domain-containing protein [Mucilaginibacter sp.]|uniref:SIMPL domain-containing protein n=1 Tax=Mucilaginibacter sp. TaxID=1882438 RepID=UPI00285084A9|nr:SIMPL domain-containing protein [Mucilaginibacter sp.]MDR3693126.1 SIMPL domain-containing protein [Mucilaginibacter sp.]